MGAKILVAEDDVQFRLMLRLTLQRAGHAVTEAGDGEVAMQKLAEEKFDLVVMDIIMPNREGIETILDIRRRYPKLPVIAMSGGGRFHAFDPLKLAQDCGANFVIAKPFQPADLKALVARCLPET